MDDADRVQRLWDVSRQALVSLLVVGVVLAFADAASGAVVVGLALGTLSTTQVAIALVHYRRTMRRAWPLVRPLSDDDW